MPTSSSVLSTSVDRSWPEPRFQIVSGSITMSRTLRRGLSDEIGSWKIICIRVRASRMSLRDIVVRLLALELDGAPVRPGELHDRPAGRALAAPGLADEAERFAAPDVEADAGHRVDDQPRAANGELDDQILDAQQHVVGVAEVNLPRAGHQDTSSNDLTSDGGTRRGTDGDWSPRRAPVVARGTRASRPGTSRRTGDPGSRPGSAAAPRRGSGPGRSGSGARTGSPWAG